MAERQSERLLTQLDEMILERERSGDERLPPETVLSEQLGVSRATLREALGLLEANGRIERRRGRGTVIVAERSSSVAYPANIIASFSDFLDAAGIVHELLELSVSRVRLGESGSALFGTDSSNEAVRSIRSYAVRGVRAALLCHLLPARINDEPLRVEELRGDVVPFLENAQGVQIGSITSAITAEAATSQTAEALGVESGAAILVMYTRIVDVSETTVALGALAFNPQIVTLSVEAHQHLSAAHGSDLPLGWLKEQVVA
jgi:GntR family transcriptional regulator